MIDKFLYRFFETIDNVFNWIDKSIINMYSEKKQKKNKKKK